MAHINDASPDSTLQQGTKSSGNEHGLKNGVTGRAEQNDNVITGGRSDKSDIAVVVNGESPDLNGTSVSTEQDVITGGKSGKSAIAIYPELEKGDTAVWTEQDDIDSDDQHVEDAPPLVGEAGKKSESNGPVAGAVAVDDEEEGDDGDDDTNKSASSPQLGRQKSATFSGADESELGDVVPEMNFSFLSLNNLDQLLAPLDEDAAETLEDIIPTPPDGGYGWVIVFASFMCNLVVDGICNSFSAFLPDYKRYFNSAQSTTALAGSLLIGTYLLIGPMAGGLVNRYGARPVVMSGAVVAMVGIAISVFTKAIFLFMVFYGIVGGIGMGFVYLPGIILVGYYFEKKRALATGLAVAGSGVGTFVFPPACVYSISAYGWQGTLLILSAVILNCAVFGALLRPLKAKKEADVLKRQISDQTQKLKLALGKIGSDYKLYSRQISGADNNSSPTISTTRRSIRHRTSSLARNDLEVFARIRSALSECENDLEMEDAASPLLESRQLSPIVERRESRPYGSKGNSPSKSPPKNKWAFPAQTQLSQSPGLPQDQNDTSPAGTPTHTSPVNRGMSKSGSGQGRPGGRSRKTTLNLDTSIHNLGTTGANSLMFSKQDLKSKLGQVSRVSARSFAQSLSRMNSHVPLEKAQSVFSVQGVDPSAFARPMSRRDIFLQGSIRNLNEFKQEGKDYRHYRESQISIPAAMLSHDDVVDGPLPLGLLADEGEDQLLGGRGLCFWLPPAVRMALSEMVDLGLLKHPIMAVLFVSNIFAMLGFYVPIFFLPAMAINYGVDESAASALISIFGVTNTLGRVFFGWLADLRIFTALTINNVCLIACGILTFVIPLGSSVYLLMVGYSIVFGFLISSYISLTSIILSDLLGLDRLTNSFGLIVVSRGISALIGPPFAGVVQDLTQSHSATFFLAGGLLLVGGLISCTIPYILLWEERREKDFNKTKEEQLNLNEIKV